MFMVGFRFWGLGLGVRELGFRAWFMGLGLVVLGLGFQIWG